MRNNHTRVMRDFIERHMFLNKCKITHKDILNQTNANCSYSVLKALKNYYDITFEVIKKENCSYREYTISRKEIKKKEVPQYGTQTTLW